MYRSLWVTSSYHLLSRDFQTSKATPSASLERLPRSSENYPKNIHCPAPCFQACNLFLHAPRSYSSSTSQWALLTSQRSIILSHCVGYHSATPTVTWKTHIGIFRLSFYTRWGGTVLCWFSTSQAPFQNFPRKFLNISRKQDNQIFKEESQ